MHAVGKCVSLTTQLTVSRRVCHVIVVDRSCRWPRQFHRSATLCRVPNESNLGDQDATTPPAKNELNDSEDITSEGAVADSPRALGVDNALLNNHTRSGKSISGRLRGTKQKQLEGLPPVILPGWFLERNVKLVGAPALGESLAVFGETSVSGNIEEAEATFAVELTRQLQDTLAAGLQATKDARYSIHVDVYREIMAAFRAGLTLRSPKNAASFPLCRPVTILKCPKDGGTFYLDSVVETIAAKLDADLIRLDALDISHIVSSYVGENLAVHQSRLHKTAVLGYEAHKIAGRLQEHGKEDEQADENEGVVDEDEKDTWPSKFQSFRLPKDSKALSHLAQNPRFWKGFDSFDQGNSDSSQGFPVLDIIGVRGDRGSLSKSGSMEQWNDLKIATVMEKLISAADTKRASCSGSTSGVEATARLIERKNVILHLRDYTEINSTSIGSTLVARLRNVVNKSWQDGRNIILVGTSSAGEDDPAFTRSEISQLQSDTAEGDQRTIFVPPDRREEQSVAFEADERALVRSVNVRHIEDMMRKLANGQDLPLNVDIETNIDSASIYSSGLEDTVWSYAKVYRLATTIIGLDPTAPIFDGALFTRASDLLTSSDQAKFKWGATELKESSIEVEDAISHMNNSASPTKRAKDRLKQVMKTCTSHEKRLLSGVIVPSDIKTTFADIRASQNTVEALKTLTSLSLIRPEAFTYGVLATDRIPGVLLYGPPGTGKTMLARAVAKTSGATVLEISGAEVNDMYVGEGEKNVKAVFSLAKKLSPCIVFIDEADAIFASRGEARRSGSHREMINQFLREWDGMADTSAFMMVATNRPFDLDEAVLRRLPRRLLIDLPTENDREAILQIHLRHELLDESISLPSLAKGTPFYSGSDLKNLSVAAALACIREENDAAAQYTGSEPYRYPEKRIINQRHFDKALEEISASISEDMTTLAAIRKFDDKYGDRRGKRRKINALGFGGTRERDSEAAQVRKSEAV